jgi:hypothetical protein
LHWEHWDTAGEFRKVHTRQLQGSGGGPAVAPGSDTRDGSRYAVPHTEHVLVPASLQKVQLEQFQSCLGGSEEGALHTEG